MDDARARGKRSHAEEAVGKGGKWRELETEGSR
jgi:hypothetical protein